ncbi:hypothetical protein THAOC_11939 [Thalassiosira oceanica]|uniref:Uncharacterized protein n=1 Tax=Thalassiosira oceanica TaxID=159749 RepID=K0SNY2_THAOC|nr:hypothetical protein THAOC_11939 [Thalassiosira oceanica]|eukprot:EJK67075.1 hypothetical protein THAOC_11939 [Thalassiosira oceanica]
MYKSHFQPKLVPSQDDIEEIYLRQCEADDLSGASSTDPRHDWRADGGLRVSQHDQTDLDPVLRLEQRTALLEKTSHVSKKDGDQFLAVPQSSLPVGTRASHQFDGRPLDRHDECCRGKSGHQPTIHSPSATFMASDDEVFFNAGNDQAYRRGALSMDPKLVDSFLHSSLTLNVDPLVGLRCPAASSPPSELGIHSPEGVDDFAALAVQAPERVPTEDQVPEGAVDSTVDPTAAASTKAAVYISSRRASNAPVIVSEGACAEQGPIGAL